MQPLAERIIRETWTSLGPIRLQAAALFYDRLFAIDPATQALFVSHTMDVQYEKFLQTVDHLVASLEERPRVIEDLQALAIRHAGYGVILAHYEPVGEALLWALERGLGERWTPAVQQAWTELYAWIAGVMRRAATLHA